MKRSSVVTALALMLLCGTLRADKPAGKPQKPPTGMGKYLMFLKTAPAVPPGQTAKKIVPPDVAKMGGVVLQKKDGYQIVYLPFPALKQLRKDDNVDFTQRIWMGETPEEWQATEAISADSSLMRTRSDSLTETASWGPKTYSYDGEGNVKRIAEFDPAGNIKSDGTEKFRYDGASRLAQAIVNGVTETYTYDSFGNLTQKQTASAVSSLNVDSTSNRISNYTYDIAGDVTQTPRNLFAWDALGMLVAVSQNMKRMFYDADDERVGFTLGSDGSFSRWIISDFEGRPLREFRSDYPLSYYQDAEWIWTEDWVYAGEQLVGGETAGPWGVMGATIPVDRRRRHYHLDHLGSIRMITTDTGAISLGVHNYYPYGTEQSMFYQEEYNFGGTGGIRPEPARFTGHYRDFNGYWNFDNTDYLDYMHARFYDPQQERFLSPDPKQSGKTTLPQSWNRYAYAMDNPLTLLDPDGREWKKYAKEIGALPLIELLASRSKMVKNTLDAYDGPDKPDLMFQRKNVGRRGVDGDEMGNFKANPVKQFEYDFEKMKVFDESSLYPATGQFIKSAKFEGAMITLDDSLLLGIAKIDPEAARVIFHEIGHGDLAVFNFAKYLRLTAKDKTDGIKHDDRDVEKEAIEYEKKACKESKACGDDKKDP